MLPDFFFERDLHRMPGCIGRVNDAALAVAAFAGQVEAEFGLLVAGERHALRDQPFNGLAAMRHDEAGRGLVAQSGAGDQRVLHVLVMAVMRVEHGRNTALRPVTGAVTQRAFGDHDHLAVLRKMQGDGQTGQAAADDGDIEFHGGDCCFSISAL